MIEAVLWNFTSQATPSEQATIQTAVEKHMAWYKGDGICSNASGHHDRLRSQAFTSCRASPFDPRARAPIRPDTAGAAATLPYPQARKSLE